jgi:hypothetical protein
MPIQLPADMLLSSLIGLVSLPAWFQDRWAGFGVNALPMLSLAQDGLGSAASTSAASLVEASGFNV